MIEIPLSKPDIGELEIAEVVAVLKSSRLSLGPKLKEFEERVSALVRLPYAVAVSSGTAALHLCLVAMGIGKGDEVILPSFTFVAVANAVRYVGATPVFAEIDADTLNLDPGQIESLITPATRLMIIVHTFGRPANMTNLLAIAKRHKLLVLEDACEAIGASYGNVPVGAFGDAAVFAFYPNKQITTGEGGLVVSQNASFARDVRALRNQGRYESDDWHQHSILGYNYRLSEINAALGCAQMERLRSILHKRADVAEMYESILCQHPQFLRPPLHPEDSEPSWFVYVVRLLSDCSEQDRDAILERMRSNGVHCGRYFAPIHSQPAYRNFGRYPKLPVTERESRRTIALPFFTSLSRAEVQRVVSTLAKSAEDILKK